MKEWVTAKEIAGIAGLSTHPSNVNRLARKEQWKFRKVKGVQGEDTNTPSPLSPRSPSGVFT